MNETLKLLKNRRSYRDFDKQFILPEEQLKEIIVAARQAPTWMNGQFYSIIVIEDKEIRKQLVEWNPGNPQIEECSIFLLFVGDLQRTKMVSEQYKSEYLVEESIEPILVATTDAALAIENAVIAVESFGLGSVIVGSIRKQGKEITELLQLPKQTFPLFGLCIGKPITEMNVKPRLPEAAVVHLNHYHPYTYELIEAYDQTMTAFGEARETKKWSRKFADFFGQKSILVTDQLLANQKIFK